MINKPNNTHNPTCLTNRVPGRISFQSLRAVNATFALSCLIPPTHQNLGLLAPPRRRRFRAPRFDIPRRCG